MIDKRKPVNVFIYGNVKCESCRDADNMRLELREVVGRYTGKMKNITIIFERLWTTKEVVNRLKGNVDVDVEKIFK